MLAYMHHNDAGLTDDHGFVSLKVSLDEKKMIEAHRKALGAMSLRHSDRKVKRSRRLEDSARAGNRESAGLHQQSKEEIQHTLARQLLEKGVSLRAERRKDIMAKGRGTADDATKGDGHENKRQSLHNGKSGINNIDPTWVKSKMKLIQRTREQREQNDNAVSKKG